MRLIVSRCDDCKCPNVLSLGYLYTDMIRNEACSPKCQQARKLVSNQRAVQRFRSENAKIPSLMVYHRRKLWRISCCDP